MKFDLAKSLQILERTPDVLDVLLQNLCDEWIINNEGSNTWNVFDVIGHLLYCDTNNWLARAKHMLDKNNTSTFAPIDRYAQFELYKGWSVEQLLAALKKTRAEVLEEIREKRLLHDDFLSEGMHPVFGRVHLSQMFAAWVVHDLTHLSQINRIIAKQYREEVGPWIENLRILK